MLQTSDKTTLRQMLVPARKDQQKIVFVPTMGALHSGHTALFSEARKIAGKSGKVVVSIFVNPIQFDKPDDLAKYPRTLENDLELCSKFGVDLVFHPEAQSMYADNRSVTVIENTLAKTLCGASRPGHFDGVCSVVAKLFNLVQPDDAVFGQKDYQQLAIIRRMVRDLDFPINIHALATQRQADGLALSSRNARLSAEQLATAPGIYATLQDMLQAFKNGSHQAAALLEQGVRQLQSLPGFKIDYLNIVDAETLQDVEDAAIRPSVVAVAGSFGDVRLIDNIILQ